MNSAQSSPTGKLPVELPGAYWVIPGRLLAGANPASKFFEERTRSSLRGLLNAGIEVFIDLTQPGEGLEYEPLLQEQAGWLGRSVEYHRVPVPDFSAPADGVMQAALDCIDAALAAEKRVYVHCHAGIGRTGVVIGCYLVRHGMSPPQALERIHYLRRGLPNHNNRSPESEAQRQMVLNWKKGA